MKRTAISGRSAPILAKNISSILPFLILASDSCQWQVATKEWITPRWFWLIAVQAILGTSITYEKIEGHGYLTRLSGQFNHTLLPRSHDPNSHALTRNSHSLLDVLVHELSVEFAPEWIVDEVGFLLLGRRSGAVLENDIVVPAPLDPHVSFLSCAGVPGVKNSHIMI